MREPLPVVWCQLLVQILLFLTAGYWQLTTDHFSSQLSVLSQENFPLLMPFRHPSGQHLQQVTALQ